jgi:hypothetical protein
LGRVWVWVGLGFGLGFGFRFGLGFEFGSGLIKVRKPPLRGPVRTRYRGDTRASYGDIRRCLRGPVRR